MSYPPLLAQVLRRLAARAPEDAALSGLARAGVDTLVAHFGRPQAPDLEARLEAAVGRGLLVPRARFTGPQAHLYDSTGDAVYAIGAAPPVTPAPLPSGRPVARDAWVYRAKLGEPKRAGDGRRDTAWRVAQPLRGDEFFEATFSPAVCAEGVLLELRRDSAFPTRFKVAGRRTDGEWVPVAFYDAAHERQFLERLLRDPHDPVLGFAFPARPLTGVRLMVEPGGESFEGWSVPEIQLLAAQRACAGDGTS